MKCHFASDVTAITYHTIKHPMTAISNRMKMMVVLVAPLSTLMLVLNSEW